MYTHMGRRAPVPEASCWSSSCDKLCCAASAAVMLSARSGSGMSSSIPLKSADVPPEGASPGTLGAVRTPQLQLPCARSTCTHASCTQTFH